MLKVLKALAEHLDLSLGELMECIVLHAFDGKAVFGEATLAKIEKLKSVYELVPHRRRRPRPGGARMSRNHAWGLRGGRDRARLLLPSRPRAHGFRTGPAGALHRGRRPFRARTEEAGGAGGDAGEVPRHHHRRLHGPDHRAYRRAPRPGVRGLRGGQSRSCSTAPSWPAGTTRRGCSRRPRGAPLCCRRPAAKPDAIRHFGRTPLWRSWRSPTVSEGPTRHSRMSMTADAFAPSAAHASADDMAFSLFRPHLFFYRPWAGEGEIFGAARQPRRGLQGLGPGPCGVTAGPHRAELGVRHRLPATRPSGRCSPPTGTTTAPSTPRPARSPMAARSAMRSCGS